MPNISDEHEKAKSHTLKTHKKPDTNITDSMKESVMYEGQPLYSLKDTGVPDIFEAWDEAISVYGEIPKEENPTDNNTKDPKPSVKAATKEKTEEVNSQQQKDSFVKNNKKIFITLIIIYIILIIVESLFFVPYNKIEIFRSKQNVPYVEVVGSGYASIFEIQDDYAYINKDWTDTGKVVDKTHLITNITVTTLIMSSVYLTLGFKKNK